MGMARSEMHRIRTKKQSHLLETRPTCRHLVQTHTNTRENTPQKIHILAGRDRHRHYTTSIHSQRHHTHSHCHITRIRTRIHSNLCRTPSQGSYHHYMGHHKPTRSHRTRSITTLTPVIYHHHSQNIAMDIPHIHTNIHKHTRNTNRNRLPRKKTKSYYSLTSISSTSSK